MFTPTNAFLRIFSIIARRIEEKVKTLPIRRVYNSENNIRTGSSSPFQPCSNQVRDSIILSQTAVAQAQGVIEPAEDDPLSATLPQVPAALGQAELPQVPGGPRQDHLDITFCTKTNHM